MIAVKDSLLKGNIDAAKSVCFRFVIGVSVRMAQNTAERPAHANANM